MAKSKTSDNEDLACIALAYLSKNPSAAYEDFHDWLVESQDNWSRIIFDCELSSTDATRFKNLYKDDARGNHNPWVKTSYMTAKTLKEKLKLNLSEYVFCAIGKDTKGKNRWNAKANTGFMLKSVSVSAIKRLHKFYTEKNSGVLVNLNPDKYIISDIFLCKKQNPYLIQLIRMINKANSIDTEKKSITNRFSDVTNRAEKLKLKQYYVGTSDLSIELYTSIMNQMWDNKEVIGVSLKGLGSSPPNEVSKVPFAILNYQQRPDIDFEEDKFLNFVSTLMMLARQRNLSQFSKEIDKLVYIDPNIKFGTEDRLDVYFTLRYGSNPSEHEEYRLWTNFGEKANQVHISPVGSASASGSGGITLTYFYTLIKENSSFKAFLKKLAQTREKYFFDSIQKYNTHYRNIQHFYASHQVENELKLNYFSNQGTIYRSAKWDKFISTILKTESAMLMVTSKSKTPGKVNIASIAKAKDKNSNAVYSKTKSSVDVSLLESIKDFYSQYTSFLSNNPGSMGNFIGYKNSTLTKMKQYIRQGNYEGFYSSTQKSFALLSNAEFGYIFATHNTELKEFVKKQIILSLYSALSGRGYIVFNGKRFRSGDIFVDNIKSPVYVKVGI